ncbi:hypothetical protein OHT76_09080 [Streptomyces sp. NBC_00287]|uniref:hypothetical protein n=1 Tax=Streptomyces sp. NBC_00287 TaxID=2975702 RepID=UPI002E285378|nr:hypothetical protein [Streptomyces sp. NBC_00287]
MDPPSWLRPGPKSPNLENSPDPESVYDELGENPGNCSKVLGTIAAEPDSGKPQWQVLRGLAHACLALQGQSGGNWDTAAQDFAAAEGQLGTCKGLAAHRVLGDVLRFHEQHPSATVRLRSSKGSGGADVCAFRIAEVTAGGPGERITISVSGAHFSSEDLQSTRVFIDKKQSNGGLTLVSESGDGFSFTAEVPPLDIYPKTVDVTIDYRGETTKKDAVTIEDPNPTGSSPEVSPSPVISPSL